MFQMLNMNRQIWPCTHRCECSSSWHSICSWPPGRWSGLAGRIPELPGPPPVDHTHIHTRTLQKVNRKGKKAGRQVRLTQTREFQQRRVRAAAWTPHHLSLAHGLAVGARASDVEERLLLGGGQRRRWSADITPPGGGKRWGGGGLTPPTREAFYTGRGADRPGALAWETETQGTVQNTTDVKRR